MIFQPVDSAAATAVVPGLDYFTSTPAAASAADALAAATMPAAQTAPAAARAALDQMFGYFGATV